MSMGLFVYSVRVPVVWIWVLVVKTDVFVPATAVGVCARIRVRQGFVLMLLVAIVGMYAIFAGRALAVLVGVIHGVIANRVIMGVS